jgi:transketolase
MSQVFCKRLIELAENDPRIVFISADTLGVSNMKAFEQQFRERTLNVGIAEANMIGVAAGLAACGKIPIVSTFTPFATRRCYDQIVVSAAYSRCDVKIVGLNPGITTEFNGGTHMSMEDVGIMRNIPGMTVIEPADAAQLDQTLSHFVSCEGSAYLRLFRGRAAKVTPDGYRVEPGKGILLRDGTDVAIFATGIMVRQALDAAESLAAEHGIDVRVINIHTVKPLDTEIVVRAARETGAVVTAENHSIIGGLGSSVAECLMERQPVPMKRVGVDDCFGEVGKTDYLMKRFGLTSENISNAVLEVLKLKHK